MSETFKILFRLFANGFHAWRTYEPYCKYAQSSYTDDCFATIEPQKVENITKKIVPTFVPFTITTQKPTTVAATLTPLNQFKYSTFAPLSLFTPTQKPTTKHLSATAQFVNYYTTSTTKRPLVGLLESSTEPTTPPPKITYVNSGFPSFLDVPVKPHLFAQPFGFPKVSTITTTVATPKPAIVYTQSPGFQKAPPFTTLTTPKPAFTSIKSADFAKPALNSVAPPSPTASSAKFNIFDLYLNRLTTKAPERYSIPTIPPPKQPVTFANPYATRALESAASVFINTYRIPDNYIQTKPVTSKLSADQVQTLFQSHISKIAQSLGVNTTTYSPSELAQTTPKPKRVWRYSFSGLTTPQ